MMKQAQMMQENMRRMQEQLGSLEIEGQSGSGAVKVVVTGKHEARRVTIDPSVLSDREMLEDLLVAAWNDAAQKVDATVQQKMGAITAGMGLPAGLKLPF